MVDRPGEAGRRSVPSSFRTHGASRQANAGLIYAAISTDRVKEATA
jgi:hypothetical protein